MVDDHAVSRPDKVVAGWVLIISLSYAGPLYTEKCHNKAATKSRLYSTFVMCFYTEQNKSVKTPHQHVIL